MLFLSSTALLFFSSAVQIPAMLKPRPASHPLTRKIDWLLSRPGMTRQRLVDATGSKGLSTVSEWRRTGRIAKPKLLKLAELSGLTAEWWLDDTAEVIVRNNRQHCC